MFARDNWEPERDILSSSLSSFSSTIRSPLFFFSMKSWYRATKG